LTKFKKLLKLDLVIGMAEFDDIPTKEEVVEILEKIQDALPKIIEKAKQGTFEKVEHESMVVLTNIPKDIIAASVKKHMATFTVLY
jgi:hypothetical protein